MPLPPAFLDELRARTPLAAVIGRRARLVRNGRQWKGCCPFHNEKSPSFYVYDDHYHCFGCGQHGDAISFVMATDGATFPEAVERLASEAGMEVPKATPQAAAREARARDLHGVLALAAASYARRLRAPEGAPALDYLRRRGLTEETITRFGLGWSGSGRGALATELKAEGIEVGQLIEAGLMKADDGPRGPTDMFFDRVMFPIRDRRGRVISFGGRILGDGQPKYVNGPETDLFRKRQGLYGLDLAREAAFRGAAVVVVEGYMDVIALHQAGFAGALAPLGTALTAEQMEALWALTPEPVLCFDGDAAGAKAAARAAEAALPLLAPDRTLKLATLAGGADPDSLVKAGGPPAFQAVLDAAKPLSVAVYELLTEGRPAATPEQRAALRNRLAEAANAIPDKALASEYRRTLLDRFFAHSRPPPRGRPGKPGTRPPAPRVPAPPLSAAASRLDQARILLAILLRHPTLMPEIDEALAELDLPEGPCQVLRGALLAWHPGVDALDSDALADHLAQTGAADTAAWACRVTGLPHAATAGAQPKEALDGWWHFFGLLRGEAQLIEDHAAARDSWISTNDPAAAGRMVHLAQAIELVRGGGPEAGPDGN